MLPSVHRLKSIYELPDAIRSSLRKKVNANDVDKYLKLFDSHSFTFNIFEFDLDYHNQFFYGGNLLNVEIPEEKVKQFIEKHESTFDRLADEYIKKIHYFEKL
jgi:hypothetical protein